MATTDPTETETTDTTSEAPITSILNMEAVKAVIDKRRIHETESIQAILIEGDQLLEESLSDLGIRKHDAQTVFDNVEASLADKQAAAEAYRDAMKTHVDFIGTSFVASSTTPSGPALTPRQEQAVTDVDSGRLFQLPSGAWADKEWNSRRPQPAPPNDDTNSSEKVQSPAKVEPKADAPAPESTTDTETDTTPKAPPAKKAVPRPPTKKTAEAPKAKDVDDAKSTTDTEVDEIQEPGDKAIKNQAEETTKPSLRKRALNWLAETPAAPKTTEASEAKVATTEKHVPQHR